MRRKTVLSVAGVLVVLLVSVLGVGTVSGHEDHGVIKFGVFPYKSPRTIVKLYSPIARRLQQALGKKVQLVTAPDFKSFVARSKKGEYDLALPCVNCFYQMRGAGYSVIAKGEPDFYGATVVRKDSGIGSLSQLKGKKIASIGKHSYAGHLFLLKQLHDQGLDPRQDVQFQFLGKLDSVIFGVINKTYDAGTIRRDALDSRAFKGVAGDLKFISLSEPIPQFPFVVKNDLSDDEIRMIREVLVALNPADEVDRQILESLRLREVVAATDADYEPFRVILQQAQAFSNR